MKRGEKEIVEQRRKGEKKEGGEEVDREGERIPLTGARLLIAVALCIALSRNEDDALSRTSVEYVWQDSR